MEYTCGACGQKVSGDIILLTEHTDKHIIDLVKNDHPDWVEKSGICRKCFEYYKAEIAGSVFKDSACVLRQRKARKLWGNLFGFLKKKG